MKSHFQWHGTQLILHCQIQPRASRNEILGLFDDRLKIRIQSPPVDGRANEHLIEQLADWFNVPKRQITLIRGATGRLKTLSIENPLTLPANAQITPRPPDERHNSD